MSKPPWSLLLAAFVGVAPGQAQLPAGYYSVPTQLLPDSLREVRLDGRFVITVSRTSASLFERRLIESAESLYPPADSITKAGRTPAGGGNAAPPDSATKVPGPRWWVREWDGVFLPFAITGAAVSHYIDRVRAFSEGANPFSGNKAPVEHRALVEYTAHVTPYPVHPGNFEVPLKVKYSFYCGPLCALSFTHTRVIEFDANGKAVHVTGDRLPTIIVS